MFGLLLANNKRRPMSSAPADPILYERVKASVYKKIPQHSAYRSGHVVQAYKRAFRKKHGSRSPYRSRSQSRSRSRSRSTSRKSRAKSRSRTRSRRSGSLSRWFAERWRNQRGEVGYRYKSDVYRPTRRVNSRTPTTFRELGSRRVSRARREKSRKGRVARF